MLWLAFSVVLMVIGADALDISQTFTNHHPRTRALSSDTYSSLIYTTRLNIPPRFRRSPSRSN
ncbi:hypothetical protein OSTOST_08288 [Ostertagia ostertagi]